MECGCGRSPTGKCIGWHALSEEEYQEKLKNIRTKNWLKEKRLNKKQEKKNDKQTTLIVRDCIVLV